MRCPFCEEKLDTVRVAAYLGIPHVSEKRYSLLFDYLGLAESVVQVNTVWNFRAKKVVRVQEKQV